MPTTTLPIPDLPPALDVPLGIAHDHPWWDGVITMNELAQQLGLSRAGLDNRRHRAERRGADPGLLPPIASQGWRRFTTRRAYHAWRTGLVAQDVAVRDRAARDALVETWALAQPDDEVASVRDTLREVDQMRAAAEQQLRLAASLERRVIADMRA